MIDDDLNRRAEEAKAEIDRDLRRLEAEEAEDARLAGQPEFQQLGEGRYRLAKPGVDIEVDFLRRVSGALKGEVVVGTTIPGAKTSDRILSAEDLNLSSSRARRSFGQHLGELSRLKEFDWAGFVEEFAVRVLAAERRGQPAVLLGDLPRPKPDETLNVDGVTLLQRHPVILFGDGGTAKSYLALYFGGTLAEEGYHIGLFDWELCGEDHRDRLERLFGCEMPEIHYARCSRALVYESDRLRRIVREAQLDYCIFDSIAFACDGPPESAEVAGRYFQALRQLGPIGSLHLAHTTKALESAERRPFGSTFWHNGARATWNVKLAETTPEDSCLTIGLYNRKANLGPLRQAAGFEFRFDEGSTLVSRIDPADVADLASSLSTWERIRLALKRGSLTRDELKAKLPDVRDGTLRTTLSRAKKRGHLLEFDDDRVALPERRRTP